MTKSCPKCGKELPQNAKFCMDCGYSFEKAKSSSSLLDMLSDGKVFLVLIAIILIVGGIFILTSGSGGSDSVDVDDGPQHEFDLTITGVDGYGSDYDGKKRYTLYTEALFIEVPSDLKGYIVKTIYYDENDTAIGQETESLSNVYYDTDYSISFGHYTSYTKLDVDHVNVEIIKGGKTVDNFTSKVDRNGIDFLN